MRDQRSELDAALADQLLAERGLPELAHLVILAVTLLLVWDTVPMSIVIPWAVAVIGVVSARALLWARARRLKFSPHAVALTVRVTMLALGLAWGLGTGVAAQYLPPATLAFLIMALAGLLSGGIATLVADRWVFPLYSAAMFGPAIVGVVIAHASLEGMTIALIVVFLAFSVRLHAQAHAMLLKRLGVESMLRTSLAEVKVLRGILPICASCKRIRNEAGGWEAVESFVRERTDVEFSHGLCPDCAARDWGAASNPA
jgi:hypothetical protein